MSYYIMKQDTLIAGSAMVDNLPDGIDPLELMQGKSVPDTGKEIVLNLSRESGDYRGDIIDGIVTLYSDELKAALEHLGVDNITYSPVRLRDQNTNTTEGGYWVANIVGLLDCVDMAKSKTKPWPSGMGFDFESMVIDESKTGGLKMFRLKDDPTKVIISDELKQYFDKTDMLVGVTLTKTEDYSDW